MKKDDNTLLIGLGCVAAYFLFIKPKTTTPIVPAGYYSGGSPYYTNNPSGTQNLITTAGNTLVNLIGAWFGNGNNSPNANDQIPVTYTPGADTSPSPVYTPLPTDIPSILPVYGSGSFAYDPSNMDMASMSGVLREYIGAC